MLVTKFFSDLPYLLIFLMSFIIPSPKQEKYEPPQQIIYAHEITDNITPILEEDFNLEQYYSRAEIHSDLSEINISFITERKASVEEARQIQVRCTERLLEAINSNEKIQSYLPEHPLKAERIHISIRFKDSDVPYAYGTVTSISQRKGDLLYYKENLIKSSYEPFFTESYSEALTIVKQSSLNNTSLRTHQSTPYENALNQFLTSFIKKVSKKWGVRCTHVEGEIDDGIKNLGFIFRKTKRSTIEKARKLQISLSKMLLNKINSDQNLLPFLKNYPFRIDQAQLIIQFQKPDEEDFRDGSLCSISLENNKIQYHIHEKIREGGSYIVNPILIKEETYDEALLVLNNSKKF